MKIFRDVSGIHLSDMPKSVVALGTFDGVHLGHREILRRCVSLAKQENVPSVVFTFHEHPLEVIRPQFAPELLTDLEDRLTLFEEAGIENTVIARFDDETARATPEEFAREILVDSLRAKWVVVGFNYTFGWKAEGNARSLKDLGEMHGFDVHVSKPVAVDGTIVSSTRIRTALAKGDVETACEMLGRPFSIKGKIVKGDSRGKTLGYPTVNLDVPREIALPQRGVYAACVCLEGRMFGAVTNVGTRPTFHGKGTTVETHIIGFEGDLYGETLRVLFAKRLRDEMKFASGDALAYQISQDVERAKTVLNRWNAPCKTQGVSEDAS
ncbi:MAG: bifunctional riboflavin kinase/FAD synthetase [Firmicutes bacterium]|nr:bifunctional riboflavin kinase/FAD synthetase [Bacillota bacterium]